MKKLRFIILTGAMLMGSLGMAQELDQGLSNYWQVGFGLGELPTGGSFKPSITVGYFFSKKVYMGFIYQFRDHISRDHSSINAKSTDLDGLLDASETVAQRFLFQVRYTPFKNGPYLSGGFVFNGQDTETMQFDGRDRQVNGSQTSGTIEIQQTRPAGWGIAAGVGYQYHFNNGFTAGFEWTPAWGQYPDPIYKFGGDAQLSDSSQQYIRQKMDDSFKSSVTNMYKVFHIGLAYRFK